ncbi:hypothetical protein DBQ04_04660 [Lactobacillus acidophilus]|uniref:Putative alpha-galactosidase n=1 Tax=Lactobacillus acidophilus (strain ATCC 700396 / NCK56 / N2 / NCFM) TaxID=272621 RepID=Q5FJ52_LACAC|nr:putative alpha-galactosidase [Lactobacillus acidophilus NCFM]ASN47293.1 hypothetical protein CGZ81_08870 [Lactobacillus acidophilus]AVW87189.1 hypothetical protein LA20079_05440 [Lactobacillus acidophilus]AZN76239.1 hypothetical protein CXB72_03385 [Lactobacillus acidophilus]KAB1965745.1 hypothetical protein F8247_05320 [Lactobacillus acidophilus]
MFEICSGGGRFDLGMTYYMSQIWASDNSDVIAQKRIRKLRILFIFSSVLVSFAAFSSLVRLA